MAKGFKNADETKAAGEKEDVGDNNIGVNDEQEDGAGGNDDGAKDNNGSDKQKNKSSKIVTYTILTPVKINGEKYETETVVVLNLSQKEIAVLIDNKIIRENV